MSFKNLVQRQFEAEQPNQIWVSDITYVRTDQGWLYLAVILERLNREIARRSRVVAVFPNPASCLRLASTLLMETSEEWLASSRYLTLTETTT